VEIASRLPFTYLHVFTYSERPGTAAASLPQAPWRIRKERTARLRELAGAKNLEFRRRMLGRKLRAVALGNGVALTGNYLRIDLAYPRQANTLIEVTADALTASGLREARPFTVLNPRVQRTGQPPGQA
jgi:threonylcarbamoyladenosine tRNA methylthiotransferase MtaB